MPWLKTVGCDCPDCGVDPCTPGCQCVFAYDDSQGAAFSTTFDVTGEFITGHDLRFEYDTRGESGSSWNFEITIDGVTAYSTGCVYQNTGVHVLSVPAGTIEIGFIITDCSGTEIGGWLIDANCLANPP